MNCQCGKYEERKLRMNSGGVFTYEDGYRKEVPVKKMTVCRNCGRHPPKRRYLGAEI